MTTNNKSPLISIIVPVYNVEKYLEPCISSLLNQTYKNIEIILINDGSTDSSSDICNKYAKKYKKINLLNKKNGGLSDARNTGLKKAKGEYIAFVDSDDLVHPDMYKFLLTAIQEFNCPMATCAFTRTEKDFFKTLNYDTINKKYITNTTAMNNIGLIWTSVCNKLYSKKLLTGFSYKKGYYHEDEFAIHELLYRAKNIITINAPLYFYRITPNSIMNTTDSKKRIKKIKDSQEAFKSRIDFILKNNWNETLTSAVNRYCENSIENYELVKNELNNDKCLISEIQKNTQEILTKCQGLDLPRKYILFSKNLLLFGLLNFFTPVLHFVQKLNHKTANLVKLLFNCKTNDVALLRKQVNLQLRLNNIPTLNKDKNEVIISLTTYGKRFDEIHYTLYSLFKQKKLPDNIILWLDENEFSQKDIDINNTLQKFIKKGLTIAFCPNYGSYKKIIPCISHNPDSIIVICDDDAYYETHWLDKLLTAEKKNPDSVLCHAANYLSIKDNKIQPYQTWSSSLPSNSKNKTLPIGVGGTLLKSKLLYKDFDKSELFMELAPNGDDLWIWAQTLLNGKDVKLINNFNGNPIDMGQDRNWEKLYIKNAFANQNDIKLQNIIKHYPKLKKLLGIK